MIEYLQKFILGSLMLYGVYHLFLRNEKTLRFNRFYLLLIIPLSLTIPIITVQTSYIEIPTVTQTFIDVPLEEPLFYTPAEFDVAIAKEEPTRNKVNWTQILSFTYFLVSFLLLVRFVLNLYKLRRFKRQGQVVQFKNYQLCLRDDLKSSFTFLNTIYTNKSKYLTELLPSSILEHEKAHVFQKHSYDIILMELLNIAIWFNPVIYFIKQAIKLNHEYLADEKVCDYAASLQDYQRTLINYSKINSYKEPQMASRLTFGETKKRLIMMVKTTHKSTEWLKQSISLVAIAIAVFTLGNRKVIAQQSDEEIYSEYRVLTEYEYFNGKDSVQNFYRGPFPNSDELIRMTNKDGTLTEKPFGQLNLAEQMRFPDYSAKTQFFDKEKGTWRNLGGIERVIIKSNTAQKASQESPNIGQKDTHRDSTLLGKKMVALVQLSPDTKVRYLNKEGRRVESEFGKLNSEQKTRFATPDAVGEVWSASFMDSNLKWRSYKELLDWARRNKQGKIPNFFSSGSASQMSQNHTSITPLGHDTKVRFQQPNGEMILKRYGDLNEEERNRFMDPSSKGEFFSEIERTDQLSTEDWKLLFDKVKYGIWLDGDLADNDRLEDFEPSDIYKYTIRKMTPSMRNLGDFEFQFFALTKEFVDKKYKDGDNRGYWMSYNTYRGMAEEIEKYLKRSDTIPPSLNNKFVSRNAQVRYKDRSGNLIQKTYSELTPSELARFEENEASPAYYAPQPAKMDIPENFAELFANEREYGVWLDGKRIKNSELKNYSANEIHHYYKSALLKNAKNYGVHTFQLNIYTHQYMEGKPEGTWINILTIPEGGIKEFKEQKKGNEPANPSGNRPFPSYVFHHDTKTRWINEKGQVVKNTGKKGTENFQFFVPPVKSKPVSAESLQEYISNPQYSLWLNNEPVIVKSDLEISADEIHHTQDIFSNGAHQLNIITKNYSKIEEIENGFWLTVPKESVNQLIGK